VTAMTDPQSARSWSGWRLAPWIVAAALLTLPALAMRFAPAAGVHWTASDFVVMGAMLALACGALELAMRASGRWAYRLGALVAVGTGFLTLWANLAVGLVGDEGSATNLLFVGVLVFAGAAAILVRGRAGGMAPAMFATALVQLLGAAAALAMTPGGPGRPVEMAALLGVFPGGWLVSAWLFRRAAKKGA
jgi:hypothetical protein